MILILSFLLWLSFSASASASAMAENWPCWRGPRGDGIMAVVRTGDQMEVLHRNPLGEYSYASPAISSGQVFIRGEQHLFAIGTASSNSASEPR